MQVQLIIYMSEWKPNGLMDLIYRVKNEMYYEFNKYNTSPQVG